MTNTIKISKKHMKIYEKKLQKQFLATMEICKHVDKIKVKRKRK